MNLVSVKKFPYHSRSHDELLLTQPSGRVITNVILVLFPSLTDFSILIRSLRSSLTPLINLPPSFVPVLVTFSFFNFLLSTSLVFSEASVTDLDGVVLGSFSDLKFFDFLAASSWTCGGDNFFEFWGDTFFLLNTSTRLDYFEIVISIMVRSADKCMFSF